MKKLNKKQISVIAITAVVAVACVTTVSVKSIQKKNITASLNDNINAEVENDLQNIPIEENASESNNVNNETKKAKYVPGTILVSLKHEYSDVKKNYTEEELLEYFSELELSGAKDLTEKRPKDEDGQDYGLVNLDEFKKIFALYLPEENDELMWEYIEILNQREDVDFAQPDYIHTVTT